MNYYLIRVFGLINKKYFKAWDLWRENKDMFGLGEKIENQWDGQEVTSLGKVNVDREGREGFVEGRDGGTHLKRVGKGV